MRTVCGTQNEKSVQVVTRFLAYAGNFCFTNYVLHLINCDLCPPPRNKMIMEAEAEAEAIALKGDAEAYAIECRAKAEAEQMAKKADAWKEYKEAAMIDMMIQTLPKV